ncbi:hypothetical protein C8J56DRAFT_1037602 [Mycena floridula]|nr:hypothetical protein C8J56DRAFT_1037602 [Mycena floridula]
MKVIHFLFATIVISIHSPYRTIIQHLSKAGFFPIPLPNLPNPLDVRNQKPNQTRNHVNIVTDGQPIVTVHATAAHQHDPKKKCCSSASSSTPIPHNLAEYVPAMATIDEMLEDMAEPSSEEEEEFLFTRALRESALQFQQEARARQQTSSVAHARTRLQPTPTRALLLPSEFSSYDSSFNSRQALFPDSTFDFQFPVHSAPRPFPNVLLDNLNDQEILNTSASSIGLSSTTISSRQSLSTSNLSQHTASSTSCPVSRQALTSRHSSRQAPHASSS